MMMRITNSFVRVNEERLWRVGYLVFVAGRARMGMRGAGFVFPTVVRETRDGHWEFGYRQKWRLGIADLGINWVWTRAQR